MSLPGTSGLSAFAGFGRDGQMTGTTRSSNGLDDRRKRLLFRCWHRGTREMDLILGRFADAEIANEASDSPFGRRATPQEAKERDPSGGLTGASRP